MIKSIGILTGGESAEREISLKTCQAVERACNDLGYSTTTIILDSDIRKIIPKLDNIDFVFIALHGGKGENGVIQGFLESLNIPYNGSGVMASSLGMEKALTKQLVSNFEILTPSWKTFNTITDGVKYIPPKFPVVVKPTADGSTIGLSIVKDADDIPKAVKLAQRFDGNIMFEEYINGRELTVAIVGQSTYPIVEIVPKHKIYDYDCKYSKGMSEYTCPANLPADITKKIQLIALEVFNILRCSGYARADFILDKQYNPWFLEINTLPGMTETSLVPKSASANGISFNELIQLIIDQSLAK